MGLFSKIFAKKLDPISIKDLIKVDMHSHLIPGIDDGSKSIEDSIKMLRKFEELGYSKVITTPHIMSDFYKNTPDIILSGLEKVREVISVNNLKIEIEAAAEYYLDYELMSKIQNKEVLTFGDHHVLFELSFTEEPKIVDEVIFEFLNNGYKPILAHVERYPFYEGNIDRVAELKDKGALLQMNINSLSGHYGPGVVKFAQQLIEADLIDVLGSDCHKIQHLGLLEQTLTNKYLHQLLASKTLLNTQL